MTDQETATAAAFKAALEARGMKGADLEEWSSSFNCAQMTTADGAVDQPRIESFAGYVLASSGHPSARTRPRDFGGGSRVGGESTGTGASGHHEASRRFGDAPKTKTEETKFRNAEAERRYGNAKTN